MTRDDDLAGAALRGCILDGVLRTMRAKTEVLQVTRESWLEVIEHLQQLRETDPYFGGSGYFDRRGTTACSGCDDGVLR